MRIAASAVCTFIGIATAGIAIAQTSWPQVTRADLESCRTVISQAHRKEYDFINKDIANYCNAGPNADAQNCKTMKDWLAETKAKDDVDWFYKGNGRCEMSDYPCFGPALYNDIRQGDDADYWGKIFLEHAARSQTITPGMEFWDATDAAGNCTATIWAKKFNAAGGGAAFRSPVPRPVQPAPAPTPVKSTNITANDPTFQSNIKTFGADQLLALTNELLATGNIDVATIARNALLQRFPDSPLVPVVAQLIANATKTAVPAATPTPPPVPKLTTPPPAGARIYINDGPAMVAAFAKAGVVLKQFETSTEYVEASNLFSAYISDCRADRCYAIQLIAKYAFNPMPASSKVQAWNIDKLYGRAFMTADRVKFDMIIPIPETGIEIQTIKDAVELYKDASGAFYDSVKPQ